MSTYVWKAMDLAGAHAKGEVDADSKQSVSDQLKARGLIVLDIEEKKSAADVGAMLPGEVVSEPLENLAQTVIGHPRAAPLHAVCGIAQGGIQHSAGILGDHGQDGLVAPQALIKVRQQQVTQLLVRSIEGRDVDDLPGARARIHDVDSTTPKSTQRSPAASAIPSQAIETRDTQSRPTYTAGGASDGQLFSSTSYTLAAGVASNSSAMSRFRTVKRFSCSAVRCSIPASAMNSVLTYPSRRATVTLRPR